MMNRFPVLAHAFADALVRVSDIDAKRPSDRIMQVVTGAVRRYHFNLMSRQRNGVIEEVAE